MTDQNQNIALVVDLDDTLVRTDTLVEALVKLIKHNPLMIFVLPVWILKGRTFLKNSVQDKFWPNPDLLPYNTEVLEFIKNEKAKGRPLILATASRASNAKSVAEYLGIFDDLLHSTPDHNLKAENKLKAIQTHTLCKNGFDYIGDSNADLKVWPGARLAHIVEPSAKLLAKSRKIAEIGIIFRSKTNRTKTFLKQIRIWQWAKNFLIFLPLMLAHEIGNFELIAEAALAFFIFSIIASSVYVANDLLDLESDRQHPNKRRRPLASGNFHIKYGIFITPIFFSAGLILAAFLLNTDFLLTLIVYIILTNLYSFFFKKIVILDILILAGLYTLRLTAGALAVEVPLTPWLFEFSMFIFLSLAILKRYAELYQLSKRNKEKTKGRGYKTSDISLLQSIGPASGYLSVLVFGLYVHSGENINLYGTPEILWAIVPVLLYWITRIWFLAFRGEMNEDPVVFAVKDPVSYLVAAVTALLFIGAAI